MTLEELSEQNADLVGSVCIVYDMWIALITGFSEDDRDLYYVGLTPSGDEVHYSAAGHCYSIKGIVPAERYKAAENLIRFNAGRRRSPPRHAYFMERQ